MEMKEAFTDIKFQQKSLDLIERCNDIIEEYLDADLRLTLRQLYYQLVSSNVIPNEERSYKNLGKLVSNGRLAGLIDWDAIEDRVRQPKLISEWSSIRQLVASALTSFRLPRLEGQETYMELWVEKDALAGVLEPLGERYHITLMVNRGYSSQSAMYEAAERINDCCSRYGCQDAVVLYLGDLDPSGEDMVRDIRERLELFAYRTIHVEKVALNIDQVQEYNLPPNPAKLSDSRAAAFIAKYGRSSWEVDALPPRVLQELISDAIESYLDLELMEKIEERERLDKERLRDAVRALTPSS
jgi:hypothetical protein